jgi:hypothetical protein
VPTSRPDPIQDALALTRALGSLVAASDQALGVYWGAAPHVVSREQALIDDFGPESLPVFTWVAFWPIRLDDGRPGLVTHGLAHFDQNEMIIVGGTDAKLGTLFELAVDAAHYVLVNGPILEDGHTFGRTETEKLPVRHVPAPWDASETVVQLEMP